MAANEDPFEKLKARRDKAVEQENEILSRVQHRRSALGVVEYIGAGLGISILIILGLYIIIDWLAYILLWIFGVSHLHDYIIWFFELTGLYIALIILLFSIIFSVNESIEEVRRLDAQISSQRTIIRGLDNEESKLKSTSRPQRSSTDTVITRGSEPVDIEADTYKHLLILIQTIVGIFIFWMTLASAVREFVIFQTWFYNDFLSVWDTLKHEFHLLTKKIGVTIPNYSTLIDAIVVFSTCIRAAFVISNRLSNFFPFLAFLSISAVAIISHLSVSIYNSGTFDSDFVFLAIQFGLVAFSLFISSFAFCSVGADFLGIDLRDRDVPIMPVDWAREYLLWLFISIAAVICILYFCIETASTMRIAG